MDPHETKIYLALLIAGGVVGIIIIYFVITIIRQQRKNLELYKEKVKAEITTLENERKRLVADLHDELGPLLSIAKLQINSLNSTNEEDLQLVSTASRHIDSVLHKMWEIANNLMPQVLSRKGLIPALKEFTNLLNSTQPIQFTLEAPTEMAMGKEKEIHIYRVIQEIAHNALKHSHASTVQIQIREIPGKIIIEMADDGVGFDYTHMVHEGAGLGLKNLLSRIELLQGELFIDTAPGKGTRYTAEMTNK